MTMKDKTPFYVASGLGNIHVAKDRIAYHESRGRRVTYNWTTHGSLQSAPYAWRDIAKAEAQGVADAAFAHAIMPGFRGTHVEIGIAIGAALAGDLLKPVILETSQEDMIGPGGYTCIFYQHPNVFVVKPGDFDAIEKLLKTYLEARS